MLAAVVTLTGMAALIALFVWIGIGEVDNG